MLTIFAVPKSFSGHIDLIQTNALRSWLALRPKCEVILFGDDAGVATAANAHGVRHVAEVASNEFGTPLLDDVFGKAQELATTADLCYVNADIILLSDFLPALRRVRETKQRFLMVGRRWDVDVSAALNFDSPRWEPELRRVVDVRGIPRSAEWIDYFAFNRELFGSLRPFALGRVAFDNWLLWKAAHEGGAIVDASRQVLVVHQNHDYSHHPDGQKGVWEGVEAQRNWRLMETWDHCYFLSDATHRLTKAGVRTNLRNERFRRWWNRRIKPAARLRRARTSLLIRTLPVRQSLRLRRTMLATLSRRFRRLDGR